MLYEVITEDQALDALELMGLAGREDLACRYLSQGQKRRVALARLVNERRPLWLLDEPFVALDVGAVELVAGLIGAHLQRGGLAVLTTHQPVEITAGTVRQLVVITSYSIHYTKLYDTFYFNHRPLRAF